MKIFFTLLVSFILIPSIIFAQNLSSEKAVINGKLCYVHVVKKGESLYSICNLYKVTEKELQTYNQDFNKEISVGQNIVIPAGNEQFLSHKVLKKQTLYSISKMYGVSVEEITKNNPSCSEGIENGMILKIPNINYKEIKVEDTTEIVENKNIIKETPKDSVKTIPGDLQSIVAFVESPCANFEYKGETMNVAMLLPLYLNSNKYMRASEDKKTPKIIYYKNSQNFLEYYEGALIALDSLRRLGFNVNVHVFDTENDENKIREIIENDEFKNVDLIIGSVYPENMKIVADFARDNNINIISPLAQCPDVLSDNPFFFQVNPTMGTRLAQIINYVEKVENKNIIVVRSDNSADAESQNLHKTIMQGLTQGTDTTNIFKEIDYRKTGFAGVEKALDANMINIVLIPSNQPAFVSEILAKLEFISKRYSITAFGNYNWENFEALELQYFQNLNMHLHATNIIDYNDSKIRNFVLDYRGRFNAEPSNYSFQGFDVTLFFLSNLQKYGKQFQFCMDKNVQGLQCVFNFVRQSANTGFENTGVSVVKFDADMNMQKVDLSKKTYSIYGN